MTVYRFFTIFLSAVFLCFAAPESLAAPKKKTVATPQSQMTADFKKAETALYAGDLQNALPELALLCEKKYVKACSLLGFSYYKGRYGLPQNTQNAVTWYSKCAETETDFSCNNELGQIYLNAKAYRQAFERFSAGAEASNAKAQYLLGRMYYDGNIIPANMETAVKWIRRAAHNVKNPEKTAQCLMVELSYFGIGMRSSIKDTEYWLKKCDNPFVRALKALYGHGEEKNLEKAKKIMTDAGLNEALNDWNDFTGDSAPSVGKKIARDSVIPKECVLNDFVFGAGRSNPRIETYAVKIFGKDSYRTFIAKDGFSQNGTFAIDQTFEACGITLFTTRENKMLLNKALRNRSVVKIFRYQHACPAFETVGVCDLNLTWKEN